MTFNEMTCDFLGEVGFILLGGVALAAVTFLPVYFLLCLAQAAAVIN